MAYYFFIDDMMLPVPPPKMTIHRKNKNKTINLINEGEINIIKTPGLSEVSFEVLLPNHYYPFANYDASLSSSLVSNLLGSNFSFKKADYFLSSFKRAKETRSPMRLIITRMTPQFRLLFDTNLLVTLEDYSTNEDAGNGLDIIASLKFKQYRPYATKELEVTTDEKGNKTAGVKQSRPTAKTLPKAYKIRNEQSIWEACKRVSGGSLDWRDVAMQSGVTGIDAMKGTVLHLG